MKARRRQHSKGKQRPRHWHHGRQQGRVNDASLSKVEPVFERAESDMAEVEAHAAVERREISDHRACLDAIEHGSPFVPRFELIL